MHAFSPVTQLRRALGLGLLTLGLVAGTGPATGCIYPDYCIQIGILGTHTCLSFPNAGVVDEEGQVIEAITDGLGVPTGCACFSQSELDTLEAGDVDSPEYQQLYFELESKARADCLTLAVEQELPDNNCLSAEIEGFIVENQQVECTAGCVYSNPPPNRECPECVVDDDNASGDTGDGETGGGAADTGSDPVRLPRQAGDGSS